MSFGTYARRVRDQALPFGHRVSALCSCVQLYRPIGFRASLSFLEEIAGPFRRDELALRAALDALVASRAGWHAEIQNYAAVRRSAKQRGQRSPRPAEPNPSNYPLRWYGAARPAALHALTYRRRHGLPMLSTLFDPVARDVEACVTACLASGGPLPVADRQRLNTAIDTLWRRTRPDLHGAASFQAWELLKVARYVETAADSE